ncbi:MAG: hypothetical protein NC305_08805 [Lachnospiraceae bacterium]|nr:hypothetical protein [Butyrivibrio sp.]MCM1344637.1 hypothetical protein [Muribaculaceae bacterium]MCM1410633.1 hypothetical protein [Lachnospiraceae bacterium]
MNTFSQKLYTFSCRFIQACGLILTFLLFAGAFLCTCYSEDMETQLVLTKWDNPVFGLLGIAAFILLLGGITHVLFRHTGSPVKVLRVLTLLWCVGLSGILILFGRTVPAADALSVYSIAETLAGGDTSVIHPTGSYLSYYPQQMGLTAFFEILIRIWKLLPGGLPAYHFIKCVYAGLLCVIICFQERTVHLLWENEKADCIYLLLAGFHLPFIMYSSFVYGEIPSFAAASAGFYYLLKLLARRNGSKSLLPAVPAVLCLSFSVMLRKNNLILLIAALIVIWLEWLRSRRHALLAVGLACLICGLGILPLVQKSYELRAGSRLSSGVTATSYLAMGMQESSRAEGWYNGFNFNTFQEADLDPGLANEISRQAISERLQFFRENPGYAARFYLRKHLSQWADGTYASRQATLATYGGRSSFFISLYEGPFSRFFIGCCNAYQNILYLGAMLCFCTLSTDLRRKRTAPALSAYLCFIAVIGGFLFHIFWEANSRYIFLYSLLLLPYAACGINVLIQRVSNTSARGGNR